MQYFQLVPWCELIITLNSQIFLRFRNLFSNTTPQTAGEGSPGLLMEVNFFSVTPGLPDESFLFLEGYRWLRWQMMLSSYILAPIICHSPLMIPFRSCVPNRVFFWSKALILYIIMWPGFVWNFWWWNEEITESWDHPVEGGGLGPSRVGFTEVLRVEKCEACTSRGAWLARIVQGLMAMSVDIWWPSLFWYQWVYHSSPPSKKRAPLLVFAC